jgi:nitrous-oxide reductase
VKWKLGTWEVVDRMPVYYSVGHIMIPGGDSKKPFAKYLVAMNKITKDRYLPTGAELAQSAQLIDISGEKMKMLLDFPTIGEPHYAQALPASLIKDSRSSSSSSPRTRTRGREGEADAAISRDGKQGPREDGRDPQPLRAGQHRGDPAGRHGLLPRDQRRAGLGHPARLRDPRARTTRS